MRAYFFTVVMVVMTSADEVDLRCLTCKPLIIRNAHVCQCHHQVSAFCLELGSKSAGTGHKVLAMGLGLGTGSRLGLRSGSRLGLGLG